jgi:hypothetical protein
MIKTAINELGILGFNLLLDGFLLLFLFINVPEITEVVKLFTSILIMIVAFIRTLYFVKGRFKGNNESRKDK